MEIFVKIGFAKFLLLPKKSESPKIWEREGGLTAPNSPGAYGCYITCFFNQTH